MGIFFVLSPIQISDHPGVCVGPCCVLCVSLPREAEETVRGLGSAAAGAAAARLATTATQQETSKGSQRDAFGNREILAFT